jgi:glycosyltransferase involved in cell wall biosynthesis
MTDDVSTPKLSIITPSYNHGRYIERTIRSVLDQGYANLEYVIVDGGSTDGTLEIIKRYEDQLAWWVSESDGGQSAAINRAIERTTGEIVAYINSDDYYLPGAFAKAIAAFERNGANWVAGSSDDRLDGDPPTDLGVWQPQPPAASEHAPHGRQWWLLTPWHVPQPSVFWRRSLFERYGPFRADMRNAFDAEFMVRLAMAGEMPELLRDEVLATCLGHPEQKSRRRRRSRSEIRRFAELHAPELTDRERRRLAWLKWPAWTWRAVRDVAVDPSLRLAGRLVGRLPVPIRPRVRGRDRRPTLSELNGRN